MRPQNMSKEISPYYPPRARWYGCIFYLAAAIRRSLIADPIHLPDGIIWREVVGGLLVPGLAVYFRKPRLWGKLALASSVFLLLCFIVWLGYPFGNYAFGMVLSLHATGFIYYCNPLLMEKSFGFRIVFTGLILMALGFCIYGPLRNAIQDHWLMPLRVNGRVVIVQKLGSANQVRRGDWIAYRLSGSRETEYDNDERIYARSGVGFGPVLAVAADHVEFSTNAFYVNGIPRPVLPHMPDSGTLTVQENDWFIWPSYSINGYGYYRTEDRISAIMMVMANVSDRQFIGKPFQRWFWRKQILP